MLEKWKMIHEGNKEIEVQSEFKLLTSEVISKAAFGSNYLEGKSIFDMLQSLVSLFSMDYSAARFPGIRTRAEMDSEKIEEEMHKSILKIINKREAKLKMGNDFLGSLIEAYHEVDENKRITLEDLIDECKTFYNAGHETATPLLTWTCLLLATHADWQEKARNEVIVLLKEDQTAVAQNLPAYEDISYQN
ncbi:cytochrome P450 CYP749A22-like [Papaver somniferum]|uniref:cytochrome P450 CYP749A22-like n=1 Tax=Papaver somniferum TaxID=3469 RepID=UPI000E704F82|nr:cytochrome P450 CYP749A22-like [Papaver somniferum]